MTEPIAALVVGNGDAEALRASLDTLAAPPLRTWCAVESAAEADVTRGMAHVEVLQPWPGSRAALAYLHRKAATQLRDDVVVVVGAGTTLLRNFASSATSMLRNGAAIVVATDAGGGPADGWGVLGRFTSSALSEAVLAPTSGLAMMSDTLDRLAEAGWLTGREMRLAEIRELVGRTRILRGGVSRYRSARGEPFGPGRRPSVTVLIPAHNEESWIGETLRSLALQTVTPDEIIVVDDCSTDRTSEISRHLGATVLRTPENRLKAGAQNYGIEHVRTDVIVTLDADTVLDPEAIDYLLRDIEAGCDATNGAVLPQSAKGMWTRARLVEYAAAIRLHKRAQRQLGTVLVLSGCVAAFRTSVLREIGGFQERTLTEDLDLTWMLHLDGYQVGYAPKALSYPAEPGSWRLYKAQVRRWAAGFYQSIAVHGWSLRRNPRLLFIIGAALWDIVVSAIVLIVTVAFVVTRGGLMPGGSPAGSAFVGGALAVTLGLAVVVPFLLAASVIGVRAAIPAMPAYLIGSWAGQYFYIEALVREWILRKRGRVWIKGH